MVQISIVIIAGLIFLFSYSQAKISHDINQLLIISITFFSTLIPAILAYLFGVIATSRLPDKYEIRVKRLFFIKKLFFIFEFLVFIGFIIELYYLELPLLIDQWFSFFGFVSLRRLITIFPLIIGILLVRLVIYELERRVYYKLRERKEFLSTQLKFMIFPLIPVLFYLFFLDAAERLPIQFRIFFLEHSYMSFFLFAILIVITYIAAPKLLQFLWKSKPLEDQELKGRIKAFADKNQIKYKEISVWETGKAQIANAGVTGLLPLFRKIFITDVLVNTFTNEEIETVIAHEFGHIKHKHLLIYLAFSLAYFTCYTLFYIYIVPFWVNLLGNSSIFLEANEAIVTIVFFIIYFVLIFRYLSRKFERQADLYAISSTGAPEIYKRALIKLSYLNYVPQKIKKLFELFHTHPSIDKRLEFVERVKSGDKRALKYSGILIETKIILLLIPILFILFFFNIDKIIPIAEVHYEKGRQYFREEMTEKAIKEFENAVEEDADFIEAHYILAVIYSRQKKWNDAKKHLLKVLNIDKNNQEAEKLLIDVYYENGQKYLQENMFDKAIDEFKKALELDPELKTVHYSLALSYSKQEKFIQAKEHLLKALKIDKDYKDAKDLLEKIAR